MLKRQNNEMLKQKDERNKHEKPGSGGGGNKGS